MLRVFVMFQMALTLADRAIGAILGAAVADAAGIEQMLYVSHASH